jgi:hypothetical protein
LIGTKVHVQTAGREATGDGRAPVSFGLSTFCLFLCENWHKKNVRGIAGEGKGDRGKKGKRGSPAMPNFTGDARRCVEFPTSNPVALAMSRTRIGKGVGGGGEGDFISSVRRRLR